MKLIAQGAEAKLYQDGDVLIKERIEKTYRLPLIDNKLRKLRTRKEAKLLQKLNSFNIHTPKFIDSSDRTMTIKMEFIEGDRVSRVLDEGNYKFICKEIGRIVKVLHKNHIIHGDLTTSNFLLKEKDVYLIDFGLSKTSTKTEDKAVDIHLLKRAFESKHPELFEKAVKIILKEYNDKEVLDRLLNVEKRGRYKH
jgi:TP53 regulating kinase and related kinases